MEKQSFKPEIENATGADMFKSYSGMRVKVSDEHNNLLFAAIFDAAADGQITLKQLSDYNFATDIQQDAQKFLPVNIRGYSERDKKAVYMEGNITKAGEDIWQACDLRLIKILNDRAFYRVDANIDGIATSVILGQNINNPCRLTNVSGGGANILSDETYAVNDKIVLTAKLRPDADESVICCEVVRVTQKPGNDGAKYEYGCRFTELSVKDQNHIAKNILQAVEKKRK